ncbi:MAG: hypothetical protein QOD77_352 [Thermoplasmata archaeon]|nr:hypothetical protein [Thermoplasmata archaeon]
MVVPTLPRKRSQRLNEEAAIFVLMHPVQVLTNESLPMVIEVSLWACFALLHELIVELNKFVVERPDLAATWTPSVHMPTTQN